MNERQWRAMRTSVFFARQAEGHAASKKLPSMAPTEDVFVLGQKLGDAAAEVRLAVVNAMDKGGAECSS
jgi:hypothetical protein